MGHVGFEVVRQAVARDHQVVAAYRGTFRRARRGSPRQQCDLGARRSCRRCGDCGHRRRACHQGRDPYRRGSQRQRRAARSARCRQVERGRRRQPARSGAAARLASLPQCQHRLGVPERARPGDADPGRPDAGGHQHLQHHQVLRRAADHHVSLAVRRVGGDGAHLLGVRAAAGAAHPRQPARADPLVPQVRADRRAGRGSGRQRFPGELHACLRRGGGPARGLRGRDAAPSRLSPGLGQELLDRRGGAARCAPPCRRR